jgi:hypothetical protein
MKETHDTGLSGLFDGIERESELIGEGYRERSERREDDLTHDSGPDLLETTGLAPREGEVEPRIPPTNTGTRDGPGIIRSVFGADPTQINRDGANGRFTGDLEPVDLMRDEGSGRFVGDAVDPNIGRRPDGQFKRRRF